MWESYGDRYVAREKMDLIDRPTMGRADTFAEFLGYLLVAQCYAKQDKASIRAGRPLHYFQQSWEWESLNDTTYTALFDDIYDAFLGPGLDRLKRVKSVRWNNAEEAENPPVSRQIERAEAELRKVTSDLCYLMDRKNELEAFLREVRRESGIGRKRPQPEAEEGEGKGEDGYSLPIPKRGKETDHEETYISTSMEAARGMDALKKKLRDPRQRMELRSDLGKHPKRAAKEQQLRKEASAEACHLWETEVQRAQKQWQRRF